MSNGHQFGDCATPGCNDGALKYSLHCRKHSKLVAFCRSPRCGRLALPLLSVCRYHRDIEDLGKRSFWRDLYHTVMVVLISLFFLYLALFVAVKVIKFAGG